MPAGNETNNFVRDGSMLPHHTIDTTTTPQSWKPNTGVYVTAFVCNTTSGNQEAVMSSGPNVDTGLPCLAAGRTWVAKPKTTDAATGIITECFDEVDGNGTVITADVYCHESSPANPFVLPNHFVTQALPFDEASPVAVNNGVEHPAGTTYAIVSGSESNAAVTINPDGTHNVTPSAAACGLGGWSYEYTATAPNGDTATATVTGLVDNALVDFGFSTNQAAGSSINLAITTDTGSDWEVDWGDGTVDSGNASGTAYISHAYAAAYAGDVIVRVPKCSEITEFRSTVGAWDFNVATAPSGLTYLLITGQNALIGDIANAPSGLTYLNIQGQNTLLGDIANAPSGLTYLLIQGQNTLLGDIANAPSGLTTLLIAGQNALIGDIANAPSGLTYLNIQGQNTLLGDIANAPSGLTTLLIAGQNALIGDIANAPSGLTYLLIAGQNALIGDIATAPSGLTYLDIAGQNALIGDIATAPSGLTYLLIAGQNALIGDIANAPSGLTYLNIAGQNAITAAATTWSMVTAGFRYFRLHGVAKAQAEVDNILVALTNVTSWASEKTVDVAGANAAPSATGTAAAATIIANGATNVITN